MILDLDDNPVDTIIKGEEYKVPCVNGLPVVLPSHVDEGTDGKTARHWHVDRRWGDTMRPLELFCRRTEQHVGGRQSLQHNLDVAIVKDQGEPIEYNILRAQCTNVIATGQLFSSLAYLYLKHGTETSKDGFCVHHRTQLQFDTHHSCMTCPAHGLRYNRDSTPFYKAPFFVKLAIDHVLMESCELTSMKLRFHMSEDIEMTDYTLYLMDSNEKIIAFCDNSMPSPITLSKDDHFVVTFGAWPSSDFCPSFAHKSEECEQPVEFEIDIEYSYLPN